MSTDLAESPLQRVSLTQLVDTAGLIALTVTGVAIFLPAFVLLAAGDAMSPALWVVVTVPAAVWLSGFMPALREQRPWVQSGAALILLALGLTVGGALPLPYVTIGFAAIVAAIFTLPTWAAASMIAIVSVLDVVAYATNPELPSHPAAPLLPSLASALLNVLAGGGLLLAWHAWLARITEAEVEYEQVQAAAHQQERADARLRSAQAVTRRIHETVLNTLTAISMGVSPDKETAAREACRHDLEQMAMGIDLLPDAHVSQIVAAAQSMVSTIDVTVDLIPMNDPLLTAAVANPLRDAIVEALRNVERHSGALAAVVRARAGTTVRVEVIDDGIGVPAGAGERFGMRNTIRSGMASIGGSARIHSPATGGAVVALTVPLEQPEPRPVLGLRTLRIVDSSRGARLGLLGTNMFMLILIAPVARDFTYSLVLTGLVVLYVATLAVLAVGWQRVPRGPLTWLAALLLVAAFVTAAAGPAQCTNIWSVNILFSGMSGGALLLPLLALSAVGARLALAALAIAAASLLLWVLPEGCRGSAFVEFSVTSAYIVAFAIGLTWVEMVFERQRDRAQGQWHDVLARQLDEESRRAAESTWSALGYGTRDLLEGIADGSVSVRTPALAARAAVEADMLRTALGLGAPTGDAVGHLARRLVRVAARTGATVEVELLSEFTRADHYPDEVLATLETAISFDPQGHHVLRGFTDAGYEELVAVVPARVTGLPSTQTFGDTEVHVIVGQTETHVLVRRPCANAPRI